MSTQIDDRSAPEPHPLVPAPASWHARRLRAGGLPVGGAHAFDGDAPCVYDARSHGFAASMPDVPEHETECVRFVADASGAWLESRCATFACRVNGAALAHGARHAVCAGDVISVGVDLLAVSPGGAPSESDAPGAPAGVDLIALGQALAQGSEPPRFDVLAALAGRLPDEARADTIAAVSLTILDEAPQDRVAQPLAPDHTVDALDALHAEYRTALIHRERDYGHALRTIERAAVAAPLPEDPFLDLRGRYTRGSLLNDLLGDQQCIDTVLNGMDPFGEERIFAAHARHEVLALLAPRTRTHSQFARAAQLMRREHHLISVDSHFPALSSAAQPDSPAHDPSDS
jgi:hypothetical protein